MGRSLSSKRITIRSFIPQQSMIRNVLKGHSKKNEVISNNGANSGTSNTDIVPPSFREVYALKPPHVHVAITTDPENHTTRYDVIEPALLEEEEVAIKKIREILFQILDVNLNSLGSRKKAEEWLSDYIRKIFKGYKIQIGEGSLGKIDYYLSRDLIHFGKIDPLMHDHMIEDISCDGPGIPIYIWHRRYESIPTQSID